MKFFRLPRLPRSRRVERAKFLVKWSLRQVVRRLPLPSPLRNSLHSLLEKVPPLRPRWTDTTKPLHPPEQS